MNKPLLEIKGLTKRFGGLVATNDLDLSIIKGETHALLGPNGAGKTTLISQLQGELTPDTGAIVLDGVDITLAPAHERAGLGIARSFQISSVFFDFTVQQNVAMAVQARLGSSFTFFRPVSKEKQLQDEAMKAIEILGLEKRANVLAANLSHGERRQLELAMALAMQPSLLLLDEPLAGMGREDGLRITEILKGLKSAYTIILVEHDMGAVFELADRVSVLVSGQCIATGSPDEIRNNDKVKTAYLGHGD